jgi:hypothetical protein
MQQLVVKQKQQDERDDEFMFLVDLITTFTKNVRIDSSTFYKRVNLRLAQMSYLHGLKYTSQGISGFEEVFKEFKQQIKQQKSTFISSSLYHKIRYLDSLGRLLSIVYKQSCLMIGDEKTISFFKQSFSPISKKYNLVPDLQAYVPREALGKTAAAAAAAAAAGGYGITITDNMLNFIADIYEKKVKVSQRIVKEKKSAEFSREQLETLVKNVFIEVLGPLGGKQFDRLQRVDFPIIMKQIIELQRKGILDNQGVDRMRNKIQIIFSGGTDSTQIHILLQQVRERLPYKDNVYYYLQLEDAIINGNVGYTKESLREIVKQTFNVGWFEPRLKVLFERPNAETVVLLGIILQTILQHLSEKNLSFTQSIVNRNVKGTILDGIIFSQGQVDLHHVELTIFSDESKLSKATSKMHNLLISLSRLDLFRLDKTILGEAFLEVKRKYGSLPLFQEVIQSMPAGIFDYEIKEMLNPQAAAATKVVELALDLIGGKIKFSSITSSYSKEMIPEEVRKLYLRIIGPMGDKEFRNLHGRLDQENILGQVDSYLHQGLLTSEQVKEFKDKIRTIFRG